MIRCDWNAKVNSVDRVIIINFKINISMFKKISLVAAGASAAEYGGTDKAIALCAKQESTVTEYTASIHCNNGMITLTGGAAIADNDLTDGYKAVISLGFLAELNADTTGLAYGVCVIPVAKTGADDTAY